MISNDVKKLTNALRNGLIKPHLWILGVKMEDPV